MNSSVTDDASSRHPPVSDPGKSVAPHATLSRFYARPEDRAEMLGKLFDASAGHYDWINHILSLGSGHWYREQALRQAGLKAGMRVIDVACGTGVISQRAAKIIGDPALVVSVDPSAGMREQAKSRRGIDVLNGDAEHLPAESASADMVVMGYALRHVTDLLATFTEFARVLKPGGRVLILEITSPQHKFGRILARFYIGRFIPLVMGIFSRSAEAKRLMRYHWDSIECCVPPNVIEQAMRDAGFEEIARHVDLGLFSAYSGSRV